MAVDYTKMTLPQRADRTVREFNVFNNWQDKYGYIIELGKKLPKMDEAKRVEDNILHGCQSQVWFTGHLEDGKVVFEADSDALIVKGLIALMVRYYGHATPDEILSHEADFLDKTGMDKHFSMTRANGLNAMLKRIKTIAASAKSQQA